MTHSESAIGIIAMKTRMVLSAPQPEPTAFHFKRERGVVLVITLILIVILSLLGSVAMRNATQTERSINGVRTSQVAHEAAETGLRFCEQIAIFSEEGKPYDEYGTTDLTEKVITTFITSEQDASAAWRTAVNWIGTHAIVVPEHYLNRHKGVTVDTDATPLTVAPRCIIQKIQTTSTPQLTGYLITARGFANNAKFESDTGKVTYGAEAWMQSTLTKSL